MNMPFNPEEAQHWLTQIIHDITVDPAYKYGEDQLKRVEWEIQCYDADHQRSIMNAVALWLKGNDQQCIRTALTLIRDLQDVQHLPDVKQLRDEMLAGTSALSQIWMQVVENTIKQLQMNGEDSG